VAQSGARDVCRTSAAGPLPLRVVAGTHSGRNAACVAAIGSSIAGRVLWLAGPLQRPLARAALDGRAQDGDGGRALRQRLDLDSLPAGCPCCAAGPALGAGLARLLLKRRRAGTAPDAMVIQLEPEADPATLADRLRVPPCDTMVRLDAIVAVVSGAELAALDPSAATPRALRCVAAAEWVVVAADPDDAAEVASGDAGGHGAGAAVTSAAGAATATAAGAAAPVIGPGWSGALRTPPEAQAVNTTTVPAGWTVLVHDPFGGAVGDPPWQLVARWPAGERFDRRQIPAWLERIGQVAGVAGVGFIGRTERQWLGWRPGLAEVPLAWRADSRLAIRLEGDGASERDVMAAVSDLAIRAPRPAGGDLAG
jgi:hypothetical protein